MKNKKNIKVWFKAALIRAARTIAQTAVSTIGMSAMICDVNWEVVLSASLMSGILSILTSLTGLPETTLPEPEKNTVEKLS